METQNLASKRYGGKRKQHWYAMLLMTKVLEQALRVTGYYEAGRAHADDVRLRHIELEFPNLPSAFDGFSLLHLSDLHLDGSPGLEDRILELISGQTFDLCVLTGDYRAAVHGPHLQAIQSLERLVAGLDAREGVLAVLGNHDDTHMVRPIEDMGVRLLVNEQFVIDRDGQRLQFVGTDDVHYYYTDQAAVALQTARDAFTIALIHSPELCDAAAAAGVSLYLCGHTHAGQVCLPRGIPLIKHLRAGRAYYRGCWRHHGMLGVTNSGAGTSGIPVRFNSRGEVLVLRLRRKGRSSR
ncbi:MAG TPA: metallophosphoesterase [Polyangiaceae bacterium]|nr:metallophosphoesterase [Polyangiaceae bacterium]